MRNFYLASFSYGHCYFYVHSTKELIKRGLIQNFNIPAGATPRVFELLKIGSFKFPPPFLPPPPRTKLRSNVPLKHKFLFKNLWVFNKCCNEKFLVLQLGFSLVIIIVKSIMGIFSFKPFALESRLFTLKLHNFKKLEYTWIPLNIFSLDFPSHLGWAQTTVECSGITRGEGLGCWRFNNWPEQLNLTYPKEQQKLTA